MAEVPSELSARISNRIMKDLKPSLVVLYGKVGLAISAGTAISLVMCGQFGIGFTASAVSFTEKMHQSGHLVCALICGALFSVVPLLVLRLVCSAHQFQVILRNQFHAQLVWIGCFGWVLAYHGDMGSDFVYLGIWLLTSFIVFEAGGLLIDRLGRRFWPSDSLPQS